MKRSTCVLVSALAVMAALATSCGDDDGPAGGGGGGSGGGSGGGAGGGGGSVDGGGTGGGGGGGGTTLTYVPCNDPDFGLYADAACTTIADGLEAFQPRYVLWSDGADKERFVSLPAGEQIDTSKPDGWVFPVGTRFFKTFSYDGTHIETRIFEKVEEGTGIAAWDFVAYMWNAEQTMVAPVPDGVEDALGTEHDIPSTNDCTQCHAPVATDVGLGFSAIQLNHELGGITLASLNDDEWITDVISTDDALAPGTPTTSAALGYLHANCGHCHGGTAPHGASGGRPAFHMRLLVADVEPMDTATYETGLGVASTWQPVGSPTTVDRIAPAPTPGDLDDSAIWIRTGVRDDPPLVQMPRLGTEVVDEAGRAILSAWLMELADG